MSGVEIGYHYYKMQTRTVFSLTGIKGTGLEEVAQVVVKKMRERRTKPCQPWHYRCHKGVGNHAQVSVWKGAVHGMVGESGDDVFSRPKEPGVSVAPAK